MKSGIDIVFALVDKGSALFSLLLFQVKVGKQATELFLNSYKFVL